MKKITAILAASAALFAAQSALAQSPEAADAKSPVDRASVGPEERMSMAAYGPIFRALETVMEPKKALRLSLLAKQKAAAATCEGLDVDQARYREALNAALADVTKLTKPGESNVVLTSVMYQYGAMFGAELALSAYNPDQYCESLAELKSDLIERQKEDSAAAKLLILKE